MTIGELIEMAYCGSLDLDALNDEADNMNDEYYVPNIVNVIYNAPATIVFWEDSTKTVVKCQPGDKFDKELGLALAISKKFFNNKGNFNEVFKKWCR